MPTFLTGTVTRVLEEHEDIQLLEVGERRAVLYPRYAAPARPGDRVVLNTTAVELGLGSGGWDFVVWNLAVQEHRSEPRGHVMKLRYTPLQSDVAHAESGELETSLDGTPVVATCVHSQLLPVVAGIRMHAPQARVAYVMTDGGALEAAWSHTVRRLKELGWLCGVVTAGHALGGDLEAVNVYSGLGVARHALRADVVVAGIGPGVVGTRTRLGHTGLDQGLIVNAAASLGGAPVVAARMSSADPRERHRGLDAHTIASLAIALLPADVPVPFGHVPEHRGRHRVLEVDTDGVLEALDDARTHGLDPRVMGRTPEQDPLFFLAAGAAGLHATSLLG